MGHHEELMRKRWDDLIGGKTLLGADAEYGGLYMGNITRVRNYYGRMTIHCEWAARRIRGGWSSRALRKLTVEQHRLEDLVEKDRSISFNGNGKFYLKGYGILKKEHVMPQSRKNSKPCGKEGTLPLFEGSNK